jgi:hypothetical protein
VLGELKPDHFGGFFHAVLDLFFPQEYHVLYPGNLDHGNTDQGDADQDNDYGKNSFQAIANVA